MAAIHERFSYPDRACPESEGIHECDLPAGHHRSRHQCGMCGRMFGDTPAAPGAG